MSNNKNKKNKYKPDIWLKQIPKVIVYGVTGMTGSRIHYLLKKRFKLIVLPHTHLDLTNKKAVHEHIDEVLPNYVIYAAGLTKVDIAQNNPKLAYSLNYQAALDICRKSAKKNIPVIYISTDAVFDGGKSKNPYSEKDRTNPISVYGKSKLAGEKAVLKSSGNNVIVRSIMTYCANYPHKMDFARLAYKTLKSGERFTGITDQIINPTFLDDLVFAVAEIIENRKIGIYHVAALDYTSNYGFVEKIAKVFNFDRELIDKVTFDEFFNDKPAPRTKYCWLSTAKFQKHFRKKILHSLDEGLAIFKKQIAGIEPEPISL